MTVPTHPLPQVGSLEAKWPSPGDPRVPSVLIATQLLLATWLHDNDRGRRREPKGTRQETGH